MFMWKWQHVFQKAVEILVKNIFEILELQTVANTFILGIPANNEAINQIFFQPEDCGILQDEFQDVWMDAKTNYENDPEQNLFMTAAHINKAHKESLYPKALRKAVQDSLSRSESEKDIVSFCSFPIKMNDHWVITVIQLDQKFFEQQYRLQSKTYKINSMRSSRIDRSFLEAIIYRVLSESQMELQSPSEGNQFRIADPERILEDAASRLLSSIRVRFNEMGGDLLMLSNAISAERYEGEGSRGRVIIAKKDHPDLVAHITLKTPIGITNYRGIRKLLEVSSNTMALLCDGESIWGLGEPLNTYSPSNEDLFELRFTEHYTWELVHHENVMLRVKFRQPRLPREKFDKSLFIDQVSRIFKISEDKTIPLIQAVEAAIKQKHGTMLIISPEASMEADRLSAESTLIKPIPVTKTVISHISSVDGAILMSPKGIVYAFGVILDGLASENGNSARGARFNSAIRYIDGKINSEIPCLSLIVSEDGYVDLYPILRPRIPRIWIDDLLNELEEYADPSMDYDSAKAWPALVKLGKLRFYLLNSDIKRANSVKEIIVQLEQEQREKDISGTGLGYMIPQFDDFLVFEEMNLKYYLPESDSEL